MEGNYFVLRSLLFAIEPLPKLRILAALHTMQILRGTQGWASPPWVAQAVVEFN